MKLKKIAAAILAAGVLAISAPSLGAVPTASANAPYIVESDFEYIVNGDGETVKITGYSGTETEITMPATLDGKTVTGIASHAFDGSHIEKVIIPANITEIDPYAFVNCPWLKNITVDEGNEKYTSENGVLYNTDKSILCIYPDGKDDAEFTLPDTVTEIYYFQEETARLYLEKILVGEGNKSFTSVDGILFNKDKSVLYIYPTTNSAKTYTIPDGVKEIRKDAFIASSLESVVIPEGVTTIGHAAFAMSSNLKNVTIPKSVKTIEESAFNACNFITYVNYGGTTADWQAIDVSDGNEDLLHAKVTCTDGDIAATNFDYRINVDGKTITITGYHGDDTVIEIPSEIDGMTATSLGSYDFGNGYILHYTIFSKHTNIEKVAIPDTITIIGDGSFEDCTALQEVTIPKSTTIIDFAAFNNCTALETVNYAGTMAEWDKIEIRELNDCLFKAKIVCTDGTINNTPETTTPSSSTSSSASTETSEPETSVPAPNEEDFHPENEVSGTVEESPDAKDIPDDDRIKTVTINPAFNMKNKNGDNVELDLSKVSIKASEIYDEEGLKRAEEALGQTIKGNKHYNLLDLTLLYDGEDFSNGYEGLVKVVIPLPKGHRDKVFSCYRLVEVNGKMEKQEIPGTQTEDSYVIYLEHFSLYALVADDAPADTADDTADETPTVPADTTKNPQTGAAVALIPTALAAGAVLAVSRKRK